MNQMLLAVTLTVSSIMIGCSGKNPASKNDSGSVSPTGPTLQSEIYSINLQLNHGLPLLSKADVDLLSREGLLHESEDVRTINFFVAE